MSEIDNERFVDWWNRVYPSIESQARRIVPREFEDVVQEAAISLYKVFSTCEDTDKGFGRFAEYAGRITRWRAIDFLRRRRKHQSLVAPVDAGQPSGEAIAIGREILELIQGLPRMQRETLIRYLSGEQLKEIAQEFDVEESTARSNLRHAKYRIATMLSRSEEDSK